MVVVAHGLYLARHLFALLVIVQMADIEKVPSTTLYLLGVGWDEQTLIAKSLMIRKFVTSRS